MPRLLIVDDEPAICASLSFALEDDFEVFTAKEERSALSLLQQEEIDCVLLDLNLGVISGLDLLPKIKQLRPDVTIIMMTAFGTIESSVAAMKAGAYHYLTKPLHLDEVKLLVGKALEFQKLHKRVKVLSDAVKQQQSYAGMIGKSPQMQKLYQLIEKVKDIPSNILITGESGTGKELVARAIHFQGVRRDAAFSVINCAAIPENLLESELFGYEKGAFTGALQTKTGLFERSHRGTVFLDEIGEMPLALQAKLLRVIQERTVMPLGSYQTKEVDIRFIAATNRNLEEEVARGAFREDLYYRLNVIPIHTPALRERPEDVPLLVDHFLDLSAANMGKEKKECSPEAKKKLFSYTYPGNVRELANIIEYAVALSSGDVITVDDLPASVVNQQSARRMSQQGQDGLFIPSHASLEEAERLVILHALEKNGGHRKKTADQLGISERGLRQKLKQYFESE
ncbi:sigma-54-dependent Fis family transcriptional regulator [Brevibacillus composti]|uniref:Sigma-54-dependent Fis family transcriptional regulator n=1 Tax=Brevibacillus composti TaxID=2796470 RepID=A0A7T5JN43_9BACL|nr:sigma-54 dependent transcriptional regulator [Brevibacillus composti]QQE74053.1 sigma-54-dependent Fis family transcriptional regulator [Brevibacillus composti]QUO41137.1 sigma-54-dependent Fis family transcriptional regulator [Brevibacillus composti]